MFLRNVDRSTIRPAGRLALLASVAILFLGCTEETPPAPPRPVKVIQVGEPGQVVERTFPGRAEADNSVNLSFRVGGPMIARPVNRGDVVREGQVLAQIDPRDYEHNVAAATSQLANAKAQLNSMRMARPSSWHMMFSGLISRCT